MLVVCGECARHVKANAAACPFCGAATSRPVPTMTRRVSRSAMFASGALAVAACSATPMYGGCFAPLGVVLSSPCGFTGVTSTCTGAAIDRSSDDTRVSVGPIHANCTITAVLGDGTAHEIHVTVGPVQDSSCKGAMGVTSTDNGPDFTSSTCQPPPPHFGDASTD